MNKFFVFASAAVLSLTLNAQEKTNKKGSEYRFTTLKSLDATEVQNQNVSNTCWSFSSLSFLESEISRIGKSKDFNLSEMFVVRKAYTQKAENYIRMHGHNNMAEGGGFPDVLNVIREYGIVPEEVYTGKKEPTNQHNHKLLETTVKNILQPAAYDEIRKIDFNFLKNSVDAVCDEYLGKTPEKFTFKGKEYTPKTYAQATGINPDDYVFLTSFTHHPFYSQFVLEVPDNWNWQLMHNLPLNEFQEVMAHAINTGYTFGWAADVSEKGFLYKDGLAVVPDVTVSEDELKNVSVKPVKQLPINQDIRQKAFDNFETQDDHGMHIIGNAKDQNGTLYYIVKNSWGKETNQCDGFFYASENYVLYKTTSIMVHKKAIPSAIAKKLNL